MKIIHTSDLHLDSPFSANFDKEHAAIRKRELSDTLYRISNFALSEGAGAIIIAGDLFDSTRISKRRAEAVFSVMREHADISYYYLTGNHERDGLLSSGAEVPENLFAFGEKWTYFEARDTVICGRTTLTDGMMNELIVPEGKNCIAVLHGSLTERPAGEDTIGLSTLQGSGINYLALGHYHSYSAKEFNGGVAVYSGTPEGRGFDETGECGIVLIDTDSLSHRFIPFAKRCVLSIEADITDADSIASVRVALESALVGIKSENIVRVELVGRRSPELIIDTESLSERFGDKFFYLEVRDLSRPRISPLDYRFDKSFKGEFIRYIYESQDLSDEEKADIVKCGISALLGEESEL